MMKIGILGTGTISQALVRGFCRGPQKGEETHFYLSPRNARKAAALAEEFPGQVTVCEDNQQVVDAAGWVFLTLLPRDAEAVLSALSFRPEQKILTIMSDHPVARVQGWTGKTAKIVRMVPLPFAAMRIGPIAIWPKDPEVEALFVSFGQVLAVEEEQQLSVISAQTAIMSAFYMLIAETSGWGEKHGLSRQTSLQYMASFFEALSIKAAGAPEGNVREVAYEMTPGGLNEMTLKNILGREGFAIWTEALDAVWKRLNG